MKDLKQLLAYGIGAFIGILLLVKMSQNDVLNSNILVFTAIFLVIVLPIFFAIKIAKKERENR
ncbi:MAG TPA: hypothetical protein ENK06_06105 [Gammaproteobacteria bacterium]|nr:hypothetical protein [Gammaproteobacteria bacterium]